MHSRLICFLSIIVLVCALGATAQTALAAAAPQATTPEIKHVPAPYTDPTSGKEMYTQYCASCHGMDGKGDGPAAAALKIQPTNLTTLAAKSGGAGPAARIVPR